MVSLNSSLHRSVGETPHFVVFGQDHRLPYWELFKDPDPVYNFDDYVRVRSTDFENIFRRVTGTMEQTKAEMNDQQWKAASEKLIAMGDLVFHSVHEPKNKLAPRFEGLYRVVECGLGNKVTIKNLQTLETKVDCLDHPKRMSRPGSPVVGEQEELSSSSPVSPSCET